VIINRRFSRPPLSIFRMRSQKPRLLFVTMEAPRMPGSGGEVRSWFFAQALTQSAEVTLVCLGGFGGNDGLAPGLSEHCERVIAPNQATRKPSGPPKAGTTWTRALGALLLPWRRDWQTFLEYHLQYRSGGREAKTSGTPWPWTRRVLALAFRWEYRIAARLFALPPTVVVLFRRHFEAIRPQLVELAASGAKFDWIWFEHTLMFPFVEKISPLFPTAKLACNAHNVESVLHTRIARATADPRERHYVLTQARLLAAMERRAFSVCALLLVCSEEDKTAVHCLSPNAHCLVVGNGVDTGYFRRRPDLSHAPEPTILFTGTFGYGPNREGLAWFVSKVWPLVKRELPSCRFVAAGRGAAEAVKTLASGVPGIVALSDPEDMRPAFEEAWVVVVPLLAGGGTRLKILEAMAMECPIVSTSLGAEGIPMESGRHGVLADSPETFAAALLDLLKNKRGRDRIASEALAFARARYDWRTLIPNLSDLLQADNA
jgi:glycosyltransferase involved in cell wall biosynthesis